MASGHTSHYCTAATGNPHPEPNPACCSISPVQSDYTPKGIYQSFAGVNKVYITGDTSSDIAIVSVYDIFGFFPQTQQGADRLAKSLHAAVYMPDVFEPHRPYPIEHFPPKTTDDKTNLQTFFSTTAQLEKAVAVLSRVAAELKKKATHVGAYGMCWGGKVVVLAGSEQEPKVDAIAALHPAFLKSSDADKLNVPLGLFISKDEQPKEEFDTLVHKLKTDSIHKAYADRIAYKAYLNMHHGWAAARADLKNEENKKEFEDVYSQLCQFFKNAFGPP